MIRGTEGMCLGCTIQHECHGNNGGTPMTMCPAVMERVKRNRTERIGMREPKIGDRVLYTYQASDLDADHQARVGDVRPAVITNIFSVNCCNLSVDADFVNDGFPGGKFWATSRPQSDEGSKSFHFHYPEVVS